MQTHNSSAASSQLPSRFPDIVEDQQHRPGEQQIPEHTLALCHILEQTRIAQMMRRVAQELGQLRIIQVLAEGDPDYAIGIRSPNFPVLSNGCSQHGFADASHALHAHP